jgi:hypothetical protein
MRTKDTVIQIRISKADKARLQTVAREQGTTVSGLGREYLRALIAATRRPEEGGDEKG